MKPGLGCLAALCAIGCAPPPPPSPSPPPPPPVGVDVPTSAALRLPGPGPQARPAAFDVAAQNAACERCHPTIAAEWRGSLHRQAWDDPVFLGAYAVEPIPFCRRCHAPEVDESRAGHDPNRHLGVACVTCHAPAGAVISTRAQSTDAHPVLGDPRWNGAAACGGCHEFAFPKPLDVPMQGTVSEHRAATLDATCTDCHMPRAAGHRSHAFTVQANPALLRAALHARASRDGRAVTVHLASRGVGHAMPTGDMFRRLEVRVSVGDQPLPPIVLGRHFTSRRTPQGSVREQAADTRLRPGETRRLRFDLPTDDTRPVHWSVVYQRMSPREARLFDFDLPADEKVLARGTLPPSSP